MAHLGFYCSIILVILSSLYVGNVHALQCYETQKDHSVQKTLCESTWNACSSQFTTGGNAPAVAKGCDLWHGVMNCTTASLPPFTVETCYCNTDLCNSASKTVAYRLLGFGVIAAVFYRLF